MFFGCSSGDPNSISLSGTWKFQEDASDIGISDEWFSQELDDTIELPGSMMQRGKGNDLTLQTQWTGSIYDSSYYFAPQYEPYRQPGNLKFPFWLSPPKHYVGPAWYQKTVEIPEEWNGRQLNLHLERPHWETTVWIDGNETKMQNSLSTPHEYDLTQWLNPGKHTITIRVDNRIKDINPGANAHSVTDHTQGNWNGIVGDIKIEARSPVHIEDVEVYPDVQSKTAKVVLNIKNITGKPVSGNVVLSAHSFNSSVTHKVGAKTHSFQVDSSFTQLEIEYPMSEKVQLWDEFNPALYNLKAVLTDEQNNEDVQEVQFGMREFKTEGTHFVVNGTPTYLRGTLDYAAFPLTGYPPTEVEPWEDIFKTIKEHGLNHVRFHSWCPPKAAFLAADKVGIYLQPEAATWPNNKSSIGDGKPIDEYIYKETEDILDAYGNHPSFVMMASGNEPFGSNQVEYQIDYVDHWKQQDSRRLYTGSSIGMSWPVVPNSEFLVRSGPRGLDWHNGLPNTEADFEAVISDTDIPYVAHETGQYVAYPNFKEIEKYTGVYKAKNFELFRELLHQNNMEGMGEKFTMASGKLQVLAYKAEIEKALRTKGMAGFQLLGINDFPGQGTALVGVLDAFWEEKGYITPEEFRRFSDQTVPLARLPKFVFENSESFQADIEVAHFGPEELSGVKPFWIITNGSGEEVASGEFDNTDIPIGNGFKLGDINIPLSDIQNASWLNLEVQIGEYANDWNFWVFPENPELQESLIHITDSLDAEAEEVLRQGGKVFIDASGKIKYGKEVVQYFKPVFWNTSWFKMRPPHTTGIYLDDTHPAFDEFPTSFHSDYQWWDIVNRQQVMRLKDFPADFKPLVQPIDTYHLNRKLGMILEVKTGGGTLIITSADLTNNLDERPAARQLRASLLKYMNSEEFDPEYEVQVSVIKDLFTKESEQVNFYTDEDTDDLKPESDE